jgi:hypothetical protein
VDLEGDRTIAVPLAGFPRLVNGTPAERATFRFIGNATGVHWPDLDEDISVESLLAIYPSQTFEIFLLLPNQPLNSSRRRPPKHPHSKL